MPTYEYECIHCHNRFELRQSWNDQPVSTCPSCSGKVRRVFHPVGIVFKGSGFYATDNRKNGSGSVAESSDAKPAETTTTSESSASSTNTKTESGSSSASDIKPAGTATA